MPGVPSRTPIAPSLVHDPAQVALDAARLSEIANLIPRDVCERLIRETSRRVRWDLIRHPIESLLAIPSVIALAFYGRFVAPRGDQRKEHGASERPPADYIRQQFASQWIQSLDLALRRADGKPVGLTPDLFPTEFPSSVPGFGGIGSWHALIAHQCGNDLDDRAVAGLMDAFALRMGEVIRSHGRQALPLGITVRWADGHFTATRATA
ncbi:hypothetical protein HY635_00285 [Candidatus Uhrbacteria bacterium]|nr:hypothetical protein [Candidatus Uhrbacteria bacterium]